MDSITRRLVETVHQITEAGIRRKLRLVKGLENKALQAGEAAPGEYSPEEEAAHQKLGWAQTDLGREQQARTPRVLQRAKLEAERNAPPVPPGSSIYTHVERLENVGELAAGYASKMADGEKPGFARRKKFGAPRGNDGY
jgi:hypothetical protein